MRFPNSPRLLLLLVLLLASAFARAGNDYPLVLVHGFMGWGRDELLGFKYWGGFGDVQETLDQAGHRTYTGVVGPFASNWDRACELYAYIKGGAVDYGQAHAAAHGHARHGRTFPGLYPDWGTVDASGQLRKIHLISHSQGGQTVRVLTALLERGAPAEIAATPAADRSPLFQGGHSWVHSVTTLAAPHDGTSLVTGLDKLLPFVRRSLLGFAALAGARPNELPYDFKLDQWGLQRAPGESLDAYLTRIEHSPIWQSRDISAWDISPDGARELNRQFPAQPEVYYFSWAASATVPLWPSHHQVPLPTMLPQLWTSALFIGAYTHDEPGRVKIDESWWENDGLVNTRAMAGPTLDSPDQIVSDHGPPQRGVWNYQGALAGWDHMDLVGIGTLRDTNDWYLRLARSLADLPP
jgi:triacylglycerol lipase